MRSIAFMPGGISGRRLAATSAIISAVNLIGCAARPGTFCLAVSFVRAIMLLQNRDKVTKPR